MSQLKITIDIHAHSSYASPIAIEDHIKEIADNIKRYAESEQYEDYNRKIQTGYEEQEDAGLSISVHISDPI